MLPIYLKSNGNPLLIKLLVNLIKRHDLPLNEIFAYLERQTNLFEYLYGEALEAISPEANDVIHAMTNYAPNSAVSYSDLKVTTGKKDTELNDAIEELVRYSLLSRIPSLINQKPSYSIHNLLYEYLKPQNDSST